MMNDKHVKHVKENEFWDLAEVEHGKARAFCRKLFGNRDDGDDLYSDTLVVALVNLRQLKSKETFRPWLYRIMINQFKNKVRSPWWKKRSTLTFQAESAIEAENPVHQYAARRRLEKAFKEISVEDQSMITLYELEGWSIAEVAQLFKKKEGAIKTRLSRARSKMRQSIVRNFHSSERKETLTAFKKEEIICVAGKLEKS